MFTGTSKRGYSVTVGSVSPVVRAMNAIAAAKTETTATTRSTSTGQAQDTSDRTTRRAVVIENEVKDVPAQTPRSAHRLVAPLPSPGARHIQMAAASKQPIAPLLHPQAPVATDVTTRTHGYADVQLKSAATEPTTTLTRREQGDETAVVRSADTRPGKRRREIDEFDDMKQALLMQEIEDPMLVGEYSESIFSYMRELEVYAAFSLVTLFDFVYNQRSSEQILTFILSTLTHTHRSCWRHRLGTWRADQGMLGQFGGFVWISHAGCVILSTPLERLSS